jgi:hypothetical protein
MNELTKQQEPQAIAVLNIVMTQAGQAASVSFEDHVSRKSHNTIRRKIADLGLFETFLRSVGGPATGLYDNSQAWRGITWGIVEAFKAWQLQQGYAIGSINGRLSTVRTIMDPWSRPRQFQPCQFLGYIPYLRPNEPKLPLVSRITCVRHSVKSLRSIQ